VRFSETVLGLSTTGGWLGSDAPLEEELTIGPRNELGIEITLDCAWGASCFNEEDENGIVYFGANYTSDTVDVLMSSLVIYNEKIVFETTWRVRVTISNIHTNFIEEVCGEGKRFTFVVPFYHHEICRGQRRFAL
jgi:hypothetical protein